MIAELPNGPFRCIVADPPWAVKFGEDHHRDRRASTGGPKGTWSRPRMNYPTMTLAEIEAMPVAGVADKDAHLYLWTINRYVEQAYSVARAWGFRPVCLLTWAKTPRGLGLGGTFVQTTADNGAHPVCSARYAEGVAPRAVNVVELDKARSGDRPETLPQAGRLPDACGGRESGATA